MREVEGAHRGLSGESASARPRTWLMAAPATLPSMPPSGPGSAFIFCFCASIMRCCSLVLSSAYGESYFASLELANARAPALATGRGISRHEEPHG